MDDMKPCPLCGKPVRIHTTSGSDERCGYNFEAIVSCTCGIRLEVKTTKDGNGWCNESSASVKSRAIQQWNTRTI